MPVKITKQIVQPLLKNIPKPISITERLGIPKVLRSNPKVLEDPYYWGYQQWNQRYNSAVKFGNIEEAQRLRDLHFKVKAPNTKVIDENGNPLHMYHGLLDRKSADEAVKFNKYRGVNWDVEEIIENGSNRNHWKIAEPTDDIMENYHSPDYNMVSQSYASGHNDLIYDDYLNITNPFTYDEESIHNIVNNFNPGYSTKTLRIEPARYSRRPLVGADGKTIKDSQGNIVWGDSELIPERRYYTYSGVSDWSYFGGSRKPLMKLGYDGLYIPQYYDSYGAFVSPSQFKAADAITYDNNNNIIPIVKRDNFHNLDRRYEQGGVLKAQNGLGKIPIIGPALKRLAYRIITNPKVQYQGGATSKDIKDAILNKSKSLKDDNKEYFLFGVDRPETELGNAYDWSNDIKENKYKNVKAYQGILNPYNEYVLNERDKGLVDELAKHNYTAGLNINMEYSDPVTEQLDPNTPMFDDVHGYRVVFHKDKNGNSVISASDLYDFGKNYKDGFKDIFKERSGSKDANKLEWQRRLLNKVGQPYLLVQKNIPIRYINNPIGNEINRVNGFTNQVLDKMTDEDIANATNSGLITASKIIK